MRGGTSELTHIDERIPTSIAVFFDFGGDHLTAATARRASAGSDFTPVRFMIAAR